eukprot:6840799-Prymnesium_polylepis.1
MGPVVARPVRVSASDAPHGPACSNLTIDRLNERPLATNPSQLVLRSPGRAERRLQGRIHLDPPAAADASRLLKLGLLGARVVAQVDRLGGGLGGVAAPALAPEPLLGQRVDAHRPLQIVGQVLVEVGERAGVGRQLIVRLAVRVAVALRAQHLQVDDKERRDVVRLLAERRLPEARLPEAKAGRLRVRVGAAEGCHADGRAAQVEVPQVAHVALHDLVGVNVEHLAHALREEDVEEEDLVAPDEPLLLRLQAQPRRPAVLHQLDLDPIAHRGRELA